jgi:carboxymethylenebutenolidase
MEPFMIELTTADGHTFSAYRSDPTGSPKGAVIVLQELYGVNEHIKAITDGFAKNGYIAVAPALFDRAKPNVTLGYDESGIMEGLELAGKTGMAGALADIEATAASLKNAGKIAIVGYCWGGYLAYTAANNVPGIACAVAYYGTGVVDGPSEKRGIPTMLHFGESDPMIPAESVTHFRASRPEVSAFCYSAGHGFAFEGRDGYDDGAACQAMERTMSWISQYVEGQPPIALKNAGAYAQQKVDKKKKTASDELGPPLE